MQVSDYNTGTIELCYDSDCSGALEGSNGEFIWTNNGAADTILGISFVNYIGNINSMSFQQLSSDYYFALYDLEGTFIQSINSSVEYCRDFLTVRLDPQADAVAFGCYKIGLYDPYLHTDQVELTYDFTTLGAAWLAGITGSVWALTPAVGEEYTPGAANGTIATTVANTDTSFAWVKLKFNTGTITLAGATNMGVDLSDATFTPIASLVVNTPASDTEYESATEIDASTVWSALGSIHPGLNVSAATVGDNLVWEDGYYKAYPYHLDYLSNCFSYAETIPCSKVIHALPGANLGFNTLNCNFAITQRFRIVRITPTYKISANDFITSDSIRLLISGSGQKFYTLLFDYMGELAHDVVMTLLLSRFVYIGDTYSTVTTAGIRYFLLPQDYQPEWDKDGKLNLAMGRIQMLEYNQVHFTTNCE
jgi:hypothetical protein